MTTEHNNGNSLDYTPKQFGYHKKAKDFIDLHDQVETSVNLLHSLESFLSTFQQDLSAVAGQISDLQDRSKDIDNRLKSRTRIEKPLSSLLADITIPPPLATLILDTNVGEPWILAIQDFESRLETIKARSRVKAARDLGEVVEGLRIVAATKLRGFFLALFQPIRSNVTTNMQVIQTSVLLKYAPLFAFLQRQAGNVAQEVQRSYVGAARVYYETGFRRYARSLSLVKARSADKLETIVSTDKDLCIDVNRQVHAKIDGPSVTLAYMADDKTYKEPLEAVLRSLLLVFMDNATAEYTFVKTFFGPPGSLSIGGPINSLISPSALVSPAESKSPESSDIEGYPSPRPDHSSHPETTAKEDQAAIDAIWKQIVDPVLEYCQTFVRSTLEPIPPATPLLTMIRLVEDVVAETSRRQCPPVETFVFGLGLQMWPVFQKVMAEHIESLKKLADGGGGSYFSRAATTTDAIIFNICTRYTLLFNSFVYLTEKEEETMIFSNLLRLRQELTKLILRHSNQITDVVEKATILSKIYEVILRGLSQAEQVAAHPKAQQEVAHWANLDEDAKRKISANRSRAQRR